jgi:hypothetical protein
MTREQYIERLIAIYKLRYKPSQEEIEEFKLLMEMMPDKPILNIPNWPKPDPIERPVVLMYGCEYPRNNDIQFTSTSTAKKDEEGK